MILAYAQTCVLALNLCNPNEQVATMLGTFKTEDQCWDAVTEFMDAKRKDMIGVGIRWRCGEDA